MNNADQRLPRCQYDPRADAAYIYLVSAIQPGDVAQTIRVPSSDETWSAGLDVDHEGRLLGVEVLGASRVLHPEILR